MDLNKPIKYSKNIYSFLSIWQVSAVLFAVFLSMFSNWEMSGESWGYWYFARVFLEEGAFVIVDRSPIYILYLSLFAWIPYPLSVSIEYIVTTTFSVLAIVLFIRPYLNVNLAIFAACMWIPYMQQSEPPVQKLALACSLIALVFRSEYSSRFSFIISYVLLIMAYLFRSTYVILLIIFIAFDLFTFAIKNNGFKKLLELRPKFLSDWPVVVTIIALFCFIFFQSTDPWNNVWFTTTTWFPSDGKTIAAGAGVQNFNWSAIYLIYGTFINHDFYATNREIFKGATNLVGMALANPSIFFEIMINNIRALGSITFSIIWVPKFDSLYIKYLFKSAIFIIVIYGAFKKISNSSIRIFFISSLLMICITIISMPKERYLFPLIPIFIMSASWCIALIDHLAIVGVKNKILIFTKPVIAFFISLVIIFWLSGSTNNARWIEIFKNFQGDIANKDLRFLESRPDIKNTLFTDMSMKHAHLELTHLLKGCKGVMSLEATYFGSFFKFPRDKIYDVWEIPPFGYLDTVPVYDGLNFSRIDCIFVSYGLKDDVGFATNIKLRYDNYILPYINKMISAGAQSFDVNGAGVFVKF